jgi:hypothetical protein
VGIFSWSWVEINIDWCRFYDCAFVVGYSLLFCVLIRNSEACEIAWVM